MTDEPHATRARWRLALLLLPCVTLGCEMSFDSTFLVNELSVLSVRCEPAEMVLNREDLLNPESLLLEYTTVRVSALAMNPERLGGVDAIESYYWSIGDPPVEGSTPVVTTTPHLDIPLADFLPALAAYGSWDENMTFADLEEYLSNGPITLPLVVTAISPEATATAVKMFTIRETVGYEEMGNLNPEVDELTIGTRTFSHEFIQAMGDSPMHATPVARGTEQVLVVDPDDLDGDDSDTTTYMYTTGGILQWSADSMRTWVWLVPDDDFDQEQVTLAVTVRDPEGGQTWLTIEQPLE